MEIHTISVQIKSVEAEQGYLNVAIVFPSPPFLAVFSFGHMVNPERHKDARPEDLAKASLVTVTNNIGAIARMCASISVRCMTVLGRRGKRGRGHFTSVLPVHSALQLLMLRLSTTIRVWVGGREAARSGTCNVSMVSWMSNIHNNYTSIRIPPLLFPPNTHMHTYCPRVWSGSYLLATTCVAMRCLCRCWPMPWSSGHRGLFVLSSSSTRATLVHWVACSSDWTLAFSSNCSICTHLYFYPRIMIPFHSWLLCYQIKENSVVHQNCLCYC